MSVNVYTRIHVIAAWIAIAITEEQLTIASLSVKTMAESDLVVSDVVECPEVCNS